MKIVFVYEWLKEQTDAEWLRAANELPTRAPGDTNFNERPSVVYFTTAGKECCLWWWIDLSILPPLGSGIMPPSTMLGEVDMLEAFHFDVNEITLYSESDSNNEPYYEIGLIDPINDR